MKYQALRPHFFSVAGWVVEWGRWVGSGEVEGWWGGVGGEGWVWLLGGKRWGWVGVYILSNIPNLMKFPVLEKFVDLMKDLKYEHQSIFPLWGRVKLNFRDR